MQTEYVIWGRNPGTDPADPLGDALLLTARDGKPITSRADAERWMVWLAGHGCTAMRIQTLDGVMPSFAKVIS